MVFEDEQVGDTARRIRAADALSHAAVEACDFFVASPQRRHPNGFPPVPCGADFGVGALEGELLKDGIGAALEEDEVIAEAVVAGEGGGCGGGGFQRRSRGGAGECGGGDTKQLPAQCLFRYFAA